MSSSGGAEETLLLVSLNFFEKLGRGSGLARSTIPDGENIPFVLGRFPITALRIYDLHCKSLFDHLQGGRMSDQDVTTSFFGQ